MDKNNNSLFYTCSLVEFISRETKNNRKDVIKYLGEDLERIYNYEDVFHCEPIQKVTDDFVEKVGIKQGEYDNISNCKYTVPDYWDIGEVFERLIEDCYEEENVIKGSGSMQSMAIEAQCTRQVNVRFYFLGVQNHC